ncbi:hypothetical protein RQP46_004728 [Phenoliferia psychrophenolica]
MVGFHAPHERPDASTSSLAPGAPTPARAEKEYSYKARTDSGSAGAPKRKKDKGDRTSLDGEKRKKKDKKRVKAVPDDSSSEDEPLASATARRVAGPPQHTASLLNRSTPSSSTKPKPTQIVVRPAAAATAPPAKAAKWIPLRSSTTSTTSRDLTGSAARPPLTVKTPDGERQVQCPLNLDLGFDILVQPDPSRRSSTTEPDSKHSVRAKVYNLDDATAFLGFALARSCVGSWTKLSCETRTVAGNCTVRVGFGNEAASHVLVEVSAGVPTVRKPSAGEPAPKADKTPQLAELCAKLELVRALVEPEATTSDLLAAVDPALANCRDDDQLQRGGRTLWENFRNEHPLQRLQALERRLERAGDVDYVPVCNELVATIASGLLQVEGSDIKVGFGSWAGAIEFSLRKCLSYMQRFCLREFGYLDFSIGHCKELLTLCVDARGGATCEAAINTWLIKFEMANEKATKEGTKGRPPKVVASAPAPSTKRKSELLEPIGQPEERKRTRVEENPQPQPTRDPRLAMRTPTPAPDAAMVIPSLPLTAEPDAMDVEPVATSTLPIAAFSPPAALSPPTALLSPPTTHADLRRASSVLSDYPEAPLPPPERRSPSRAEVRESRQASLAPARTHLTPEFTPEVSRPRPTPVSDDVVWCQSLLVKPALLPVNRPLLSFQFEVEEQLLSRIQNDVKVESDLDEELLPLRVRAIIRRNNPDESTWPCGVWLNLNGSSTPTPVGPRRSRIEAFLAIDLSRDIVTGRNTVVFSKWRSDVIPDDLAFSIELARCAPESWLHSKIQADAAKTYRLHSDRCAALDPESLSLLDPTTAEQIMRPVRGEDCEHLETFDLSTYLAVNRTSGEWKCPHCRTHAAPEHLALDQWVLDALATFDPEYPRIDLEHIATENDQPLQEDTKPSQEERDA